MSSPFNILQQSPHDLRPPMCSELPQAETDAETVSWVPSRYNIRVETQDGRLIIWNTHKGSISVFQPEQGATVKTLLRKKGFEAKADGVVRYLRDRGFLVKAGTDEYNLLHLTFGPHHYRADILQYVILASEDCNFRCRYCYEPFSRGTMLPWVREAVKKYTMTRLDGLKVLTVGWFGGDPLYGFEAIEDLAPFFSELSKEHGIKFYSNITTNGYLLTPAVAEKLLAWGIATYQITLDGPPEDHNLSRPARDGQPTFSTIFENLRALSQRSEDYYVILRANFSHDNYSNMGRLLDLVEREFRDDQRFRLRFHPVDRWGGPNDNKLNVFNKAEGARLQQELMREASRRGLAIRDNLKNMNKLGAHVCGASRPNNFVIGADGKVMKCTLVLDKEDFNIVGRIDREGNLNLDKSKLAIWTEPVFLKDERCQKCVVLPTCQGLNCPLVRIRTNSRKNGCISTRSNPKGELLTVLDQWGDDCRKVLVTSEHQHAAAV